MLAEFVMESVLVQLHPQQFYLASTLLTAFTQALTSGKEKTKEGKGKEGGAPKPDSEGATGSGSAAAPAALSQAPGSPGASRIDSQCRGTAAKVDNLLRGIAQATHKGRLNRVRLAVMAEL